MRCLIVTAHPLAESLCAATTRYLAERLQAAGHDVSLKDLYADRFDPALSATERASYYSGPFAGESVATETQRLRAAEGLVLVFPTWWFGPPAILKGWFDRVWAPGVAYDHAPGFGTIEPRLGNLREMLVVTSLGAPWWVDRLVMRRPVRRILKTALVQTCAPQCRFRMVSIYKSERLTQLQVHRFWQRIDHILSRWETASPN